MNYRFSVAIALVFLLGFSFFPSIRHADGSEAGAKRWDEYATVRIEGQRLEPQTVTVEPGTTVRWVNFDSAAHDIISGAGAAPDGRFRSGPLEQDGFYEVTLNEKGEYPYYSGTNPFLRGKVVVK